VTYLLSPLSSPTRQERLRVALIIRNCSLICGSYTGYLQGPDDHEQFGAAELGRSGSEQCAHARFPEDHEQSERDGSGSRDPQPEITPVASFLHQRCRLTWQHPAGLGSRGSAATALTRRVIRTLMTGTKGRPSVQLGKLAARTGLQVPA
jgi:hypothetical protein